MCRQASALMSMLVRQRFHFDIEKQDNSIVIDQVQQKWEN